MPEIKKYRFAVVGAGVTGAWIARELTKYTDSVCITNSSFFFRIAETYVFNFEVETVLFLADAIYFHALLDMSTVSAAAADKMYNFFAF